MFTRESTKHAHSDDKPETFRLLSRQLARELTEMEIDAVAGGTTSRTRISSQKIIIVDDADA